MTDDTGFSGLPYDAAGHVDDVRALLNGVRPWAEPAAPIEATGEVITIDELDEAWEASAPS